MNISAEARKHPPESIGPMLDQIDAFLRQYLVCSTQQRTILALWIAHTYCYGLFPVTPYLEIYSPEKRSGKTLCLRLLGLLCNKTWSPVGANASRLVTRIASSQPTLLLDNWHTLFRASGNQSIVGFLDAGATEGSYYSFNPDNDHSDYPIFCPKAFAGHQRLPAPLADRCLPILLRRLKVKEQVLPFWRDGAFDEALSITKALRTWAEANDRLLREAASDVLGSPVPGANLLQRESIIPLAVVAAMAGDKWDRKLRVALLRIAAASLTQPPSVGLQLLTDIRDFFTLNNDPPGIHSAPLLEYLNSLADRPWKKLTSNGLRIILQDFPISRSGTQLIGGHKLKGFTFQHFVASWESYLPHLSSKRSPRPPSAPDQVGALAGQVGAAGPQVGEIGPEVGEKGAQVGAI
ncbi:MAG TPA: DUF3631 domain-containing protein [Candidatus Angelobacter sp.]|nr:DUF3631 domain-containing protein [Candidatus Angelobacter sp.]